MISGEDSEARVFEAVAVGSRSETTARRMYDSASVVVDEGRVWPLRSSVGELPAELRASDSPAEDEERVLVVTRELCSGFWLCRWIKRSAIRSRGLTLQQYV